MSMFISHFLFTFQLLSLFSSPPCPQPHLYISECQWLFSCFLDLNTVNIPHHPECLGLETSLHVRKVEVVCQVCEFSMCAKIICQITWEGI